MVKAIEVQKKLCMIALNHPLLDVDIKGATGVLIHVTGGSYMTLESARLILTPNR